MCRVSGKTAPIRRRRYLPERDTGGWSRIYAKHLGGPEEVRGVSRIRRTAYCIGFPVSLVCLVVLVAGCSSNTTTTTKQVAATPPPEPSVELRLNQGSFSQTGSQATLTGTVTPGAAVTVNEHPAAVHGSDWHGTVQHLHIGENTIVVGASLTGHQSAEDTTITVTRHHTQAELEAIAQATKEREARRKEREEQRAREEREHKAVEEREEREHKEVEDATLSQQNALRSAEQYLETSAFSEAGLIEQLSSEAGSKFPHADAVFAVEHLHVSWNAQAVKAAKEYLNTSSFSCQGLIEQLSSEAGSKFTVAQAEYAADKVGLC
jgi:Host cell surface-exposed lipoprotein